MRQARDLASWTATQWMRNGGAFLALAVSLLALAGWLAGERALASLGFPVATNPFTALALIAAAATALVWTIEGGPRSSTARWVALASAAFLLLVGIVTVAGYLLGQNLGLDQLLFREDLEGNRIAPNTGLAILALGAGIAGATGRGRVVVASQLLASAAGAAAFVSLTGYFYGVEGFYGVPAFIPMALPTAIGVGAAAMAVALMREGEGPVSIFQAPSLGGMVARRVLLPALVVPILLGGLRLAGERAGLYPTAVGVALFGIASAALLLILVGWTARLLHRTDLARRQIEARLRRANEELAIRNRELDQFAYVASHDLQEPLRMVTSYCQLLQRRYAGKLDADANEFIGYAVDGATRMQALIQDLLRYSRAGTRGLDARRFPADRALDSALRNLAAAIDEAQARVTREALPEITADETQITQMFQNLVGNAIKFHGTEPPRVHVWATREPGGNAFHVRDNGIGIESRHVERLFTLFQRLHNRHDYPGTGIGLALCKRIAERHGGRIWLASEVGRGTTFSFFLPDAPPEGAKGLDANP